MATGSTVTWTFQITNTGNTLLEDFALEDFFTAGDGSTGVVPVDTSAGGRIHPGESVTFTATPPTLGELPLALAQPWSRNGPNGPSHVRGTVRANDESPAIRPGFRCGDPSGIRTRVTAVRGRRTRPLYDGAVFATCRCD